MSFQTSKSRLFARTMLFRCADDFSGSRRCGLGYSAAFASFNERPHDIYRSATALYSSVVGRVPRGKWHETRQARYNKKVKTETSMARDLLAIQRIARWRMCVCVPMPRDAHTDGDQNTIIFPAVDANSTHIPIAPNCVMKGLRHLRAHCNA